jgi:bifunctional UDP-N-acetylglucosamine pyrophosphorylase/glucosamine-1-phosphate N-acetyltransferase
MRSAEPIALHPVCGRSMVEHVLDAVDALGPRRVTVAVAAADDGLVKEVEPRGVDVGRVPDHVRHDPCAAVLVALAGWAADDFDTEIDPDDEDVLVVPATVPLLEGETLRAFHRAHRAADAVATALVGPDGADDPADAAVWLVRRSLLAPALRRTDEPEIAAIAEVLTETGHEVATFTVDGSAPLTVVDRVGLADAEAAMRRRINSRWMRRGVTMTDPEHTYVDVDVTLEHDVVLHPGVSLRGATKVGVGTVVGPGCHLVDSRVGAHCRLEQTSAELATVGDHARVGPFAVLEPGADLPAATATGPFYTAGPDAR